MQLLVKRSLNHSIDVFKKSSSKEGRAGGGNGVVEGEREGLKGGETAGMSWQA